MIISNTAVFSASNTPQALTWDARPGSYVVVGGLPLVTDGDGPNSVWLTDPSDSGVTVNADAPWTGSVTVTVVDVETPS